MIIGTLPADVRKNLARQHGNEGWILSDLRKAIQNEITIMDAGQPIILEVNDTASMTASFFTGSRRKNNVQKINDSNIETRGPLALKRSAEAVLEYVKNYGGKPWGRANLTPRVKI